MGLELEIDAKKILSVLGTCALLIGVISRYYPLNSENAAGLGLAVLLILVGVSVRVLSKKEIEELNREFDEQ